MNRLTTTRSFTLASPAVVAALAALMLSVAPARAASPLARINYQGVLRNASGTALDLRGSCGDLVGECARGGAGDQDVGDAQAVAVDLVAALKTRACDCFAAAPGEPALELESVAVDAHLRREVERARDARSREREHPALRH